MSRRIVPTDKRSREARYEGEHGCHDDDARLPVAENDYKQPKAYIFRTVRAKAAPLELA